MNLECEHMFCMSRHILEDEGLNTNSLREVDNLQLQDKSITTLTKCEKEKLDDEKLNQRSTVGFLPTQT